MKVSVSTRKKQNDEAVSYLSRCIALAGGGEKLPSIREMIRDSRTSRPAIDRAVRYFVGQGTIECIPYSGIRKRNIEIAPSAKIIDAVACHECGYMNEPTAFHRYVINYLNETISREGYAVRLHCVSPLEPLDRYKQISELSDSSGFVVFSARIEEIIRTFQRTGKPVVAAFSHCALHDVAGVSAPLLIRNQLEYLFSLGHTRIAYFSGFEPCNFTSGSMLRVLEYYKVMADHSIPVNSHWVQPAIWGEVGTHRILDDLLSHKPLPTAIIVIDGQIPHVYNYLKNKGIRIGEEIGIMATDGMPEIYHYLPKPATGVNPRDVAAKKIWQILKKQLQGENFTKNVYNDFHIVPGDSLLPLLKMKLKPERISIK